MEIDREIRKFRNRISPAQKAAFFGALIWGLVTHLAVFSAGLMYHDGVNYSGLCATYSSGRWMLGIMEEIGSRCLGIFQLPYLNGFAVLFLLAVSAMMITYLLKVSSDLTGVLIGAILVSFPGVAILFAYMFTAPAYALSLLMSIFSVYLVNEKPSLFRVFLGACFICLSLGIYQAYITFAASLALITVINDTLRQDEADIKAALTKGVSFVIMLFVGLLLYLLINKLFVSLKGVELTSYQGLDKMGQFTFADFLKAAAYVYPYQLQSFWTEIISSYWMLYITRAIQAVSVLLFIRIVYQQRKNMKKCIFATILFLLLPMAYNSIFLISGMKASVHPLMQYALVFTYIFPLVLLENLPKNGTLLKCEKYLGIGFLLLIALVPLSYTYRDNTAYLSASTSQEQAVLYCNSLVTRIKDTDGYSDELPVVYIGDKINDSTLGLLPTYGKFRMYTLDYTGRDMINSYFEKFCALHLGWNPEVITDTEAFSEMAEVKSMPCYPDYGSVKILNGIVIVKFSETN